MSYHSLWIPDKCKVASAFRYVFFLFNAHPAIPRTREQKLYVYEEILKTKAGSVTSSQKHKLFFSKQCMSDMFGFCQPEYD